MISICLKQHLTSSFEIQLNKQLTSSETELKKSFFI